MNISELSIEDILESYYYARAEWEEICRKDDYADISPENTNKVFEEMYLLKEELERRCS